MTNAALGLFFLLSLSGNLSHIHARAETPPAAPHRHPGCDHARSFRELARLGRDPDALASLARLHRTLCESELQDGEPVYYPNGQLATESANEVGVAWYYPSGREATPEAGKPGSRWRYASGRLVTRSAGKPEATWLYPSGARASDQAGVLESTWLYPNDEVITFFAGQKGATYRCPDGSIAEPDSPGFKDPKGNLDTARFLAYVNRLVQRCREARASR
jgi:hypothetical protein